VPVFDFDMLLTGYAQQSIDMQRLLCDGWLPSTGVAVSPPGRLASPVTNFAGCNATADPANGTPVYGGDGAITPASLASLRAALSGVPDPVSGQCAGLPGLPGTFSPAAPRFTAYVTVDSVSACAAPTPFAAGFDAVLDDHNVLIGDAVLVNPVNNESVGYAAVALEAADADQLDGAQGFYGVSEHPREPLPAAWKVNRDSFGGFDADVEMIVWRGSTVARTPFDCAAGPDWYPLNIVNTNGYGSRGMFHVDDAGRAILPTWRTPFPRATQRIAMLREAPEAGNASGMTFLNLQHDRQPGGAVGSQAWAASVSTVAGRLATLSVGQPLGPSCNVAGFDNVSAGPDTSVP
jgi:hypothetical protein